MLKSAVKNEKFQKESSNLSIYYQGTSIYDTFTYMKFLIDDYKFDKVYNLNYLKQFINKIGIFCMAKTKIE